jgi:hypothetical protein
MLHGTEKILASSVANFTVTGSREYSGVARKLSAQINA